MSQNVKAALTSKISVVMTMQQLRNELYDQYGRDIVDKSLTACNALNKAVEKASSISAMDMRTKCPSGVWSLLQCMVESDDSSTARESARQEFNELCITIGEPAREYITRAKRLAATVRYHRIYVTDEQLANLVLFDPLGAHVIGTR